MITTRHDDTTHTTTYCVNGAERYRLVTVLWLSGTVSHQVWQGDRKLRTFSTWQKADQHIAVLIKASLTISDIETALAAFPLEPGIEARMRSVGSL